MSDAEQYAAIIAIIAKTDDPQKLRNFIANARRQGALEVEQAAFERLCYVQPSAKPGTVEHEIWQSIHALEEMLSGERGKTVRLNRTRQKIAREGELKTAADLTLKPNASDGFRFLIEFGFPNLTFEAVTLRHPDLFSNDVLAAARNRLANTDVVAKAPTEVGVEG